MSNAALRRLLGPAFVKAVRKVAADPTMTAPIPGSTFRVPRHAGMELIAKTWPSLPVYRQELMARIQAILMSVLFQQARTMNDRIAVFRLRNTQRESITAITSH